MSHMDTAGLEQKGQWILPAGCPCKAHEFGDSPVNTGNQLADETAREVTDKGILALIPSRC